MGISQSSAIAGFLLIGFLVYITMKGELSAYKNVLFGSGPSSGSGMNSNATAGGTGLSGETGTPELFPITP